ncbi:substrate-binding domain-containing protein [Paenibacillus pasadenensis]|uniref:substrate-binding domain-containing protein n=1 Tax=Paenibacillus pasadenensis TaxID=217090 RepID=UPI002040B5F2|nr:substrate-binding domain-containing protein [Paenibacillus pasadenensis]MCM3747170.1 substrate-binding domain-containing protein [Paenibacillus pasadenensis]
MSTITPLGLSVPRDMSIVGYDDQNLAALLRPRLTTVAQPVLSIARSAVEALLVQLEGKEQSLPVVLKPELISRESSAPPSRQKENQL